MKQDSHREHLMSLIFSASDFADWIFHDERLDCDGLAAERTAERLRDFNEQCGQSAVFGIAGWWVISSYWQLLDAYEIVGKNTTPELLPQNIKEITESESPPERKRAYIGAQQFVSTVTHDNLDMAEAIFNAAYESGVEDFVGLMYSVLMLSIRISTAADKIKENR